MKKSLIGKKFKTTNGTMRVMEYNVWQDRYWCQLLDGSYNGYDVGEECSLSENQINKFMSK